MITLRSLRRRFLIRSNCACRRCCSRSSVTSELSRAFDSDLRLKRHADERELRASGTHSSSKVSSPSSWRDSVIPRRLGLISRNRIRPRSREVASLSQSSEQCYFSSGRSLFPLAPSPSHRRSGNGSAPNVSRFCDSRNTIHEQTKSRSYLGAVQPLRCCGEIRDLWKPAASVLGT